MANNKETMRNDFRNLNGFPTDNSPSTQLKYDIIASKFMTGIENRQRRNTPALFAVVCITGIVLQIVAALMILVWSIIVYIWKRMKAT
jgi:hypothetical protein